MVASNRGRVRVRFLVLALATASILAVVLVPATAAAANLRAAPVAAAGGPPVLGRILGIMRRYGHPQPGVKLPGQSAFDGDGSPALYWGGPVMGTVSGNQHQPVHIRLIFWQPSGTAKEGQISTIDPNIESDIV